MRLKTDLPLSIIKRTVWLILAGLVVTVLGLPAIHAQRQLPAPSAERDRVYLPQISQPFRVFVPFFLSTGQFPDPQWMQPLTGGSPLLPSVRAARPSVGSPLGFVTRRGENLELDGQPYTFVGTNVSYLAGPFFPEENMEGVISFLASAGVEAIRVWVEPWCDLDRVERMLDLGGQYNVRFILTLQNFFGNESGHWFRAEYLTKDLPHIRKIVPRFADRPEVLMWELMNEPTCPSKDSGKDCWDALYHWAQVTSLEVKQLDPYHLVSVGTQRAGFYPQAIDTFRRMHALETIDILSVHCEAGKLIQGELERELAIARELGKPLYLGEVAMVAYDNDCQLLSDGILDRRAQAIGVDMRQSLEAGFDGYLLWQYIHDGCGVTDYLPTDPVWSVIREGQR